MHRELQILQCIEPIESYIECLAVYKGAVHRCLADIKGFERVFLGGNRIYV